MLIAGLAASVKAKVCRTVVRVTMMSGLETGTKARWEMLNPSLAMTRMDTIRNEYICYK